MWKIISDIRNSLTGNENRIKLQWIHSHIGITGNEAADYASSAPIIMDGTIEKFDIRGHIESYLKLKFNETSIMLFHNKFAK